jgi:hypothetical protein
MRDGDFHYRHQAGASGNRGHRARPSGTGGVLDAVRMGAARSLGPLAFAIIAITCVVIRHLDGFAALAQYASLFITPPFAMLGYAI